MEKFIMPCIFLVFVLLVALAIEYLDNGRLSRSRLLYIAKLKFPLDFSIGEEVYILFRDEVMDSEGKKYRIPIHEARRKYIIHSKKQSGILIFNSDRFFILTDKGNLASVDSADMEELFSFWQKAEKIIHK